MTDDNQHAIRNARAWAANIEEAMKAYEALSDGETESVEFDGETFDDADAVYERIQEMPLSVMVRDGWRTPGGERADAEEFEILLSTGGPALRIYGDIGGEHELQWQDWGTPWTCRDVGTTDAQDEAIAAFVQMFSLEDF